MEAGEGGHNYYTSDLIMSGDAYIEYIQLLWRQGQEYPLMGIGIAGELTTDKKMYITCANSDNEPEYYKSFTLVKVPEWYGEEVSNDVLRRASDKFELTHSDGHLVPMYSSELGNFAVVMMQDIT